MGKFTLIPQNTFEGLQLDAGVLLKRFDPSNPVAPADEDIICATTGGINITCVPTYSDLGEDIDNVPAAMKELKNLDSWECKMAFTSLGTSKESIRLALGAADIDAETGAIVPRRDLKQTDFSDVWWVGDRADGGLVACQLKNALSTSGFSLQTTKNGKGQVSVELTGHVALADQNTMPMAFYSEDPTDTVYRVIQTLDANITSSFSDTTIADGAPLTAILTAGVGYAIDTVTVYMGGVNITETAYNNGTVAIGSVTGNVTIIATSTVVTTYSVTQTLTNVTSSFAGDVVNSGASLTAILTADEDYTLNEVTVSMGGVDITSTAYNDGAINIASVTGNVIITATATEGV